MVIHEISLMTAFFLALLYAYPAALAVQNYMKYKDWPSLALVPSFTWMALYFCISPYLPQYLASYWGELAFVVLSMSVTLTMVWRHSMLRGNKWIR